MAPPSTSESDRFTGLKSRFTRFRNRPRWRSDWEPVWILLLMISILGLFSIFAPINPPLETVVLPPSAVGHEQTIIGAVAKPED